MRLHRSVCLFIAFVAIVLCASQASAQCPTITISPATFPNGTVGVPYNLTLSATGSIAPYTFSFTGDSVPGLVGNPTTGGVSGTPTTAGTYNFTVTALDATFDCQGSRAYTLVVNAAVPTMPGSFVALLAATLIGFAVVSIRRRRTGGA